jgi:hypothetical protein
MQKKLETVTGGHVEQNIISKKVPNNLLNKIKFSDCIFLVVVHIFSQYTVQTAIYKYILL